MVIIDNFFAQVDKPEVRDLFVKGIHSRIRGYQSEYPESFLSLDGTDWIDRHYFFCEMRNGKLEPFGGFRFTYYSRCFYYHVPFPLATALKLAQSPLLAHVENEIENQIKQGRDVVFGAWLTLDPRFRGQKDLSSAFRKLYAAMYTDIYDRTGGSPVFSGAVLQFKTRLWLERLGHELMAYKENPTGVIRNPYSGFDVVLLKMEQPSEWARECQREVGMFLNDAILFESDNRALKKAA